MKAMGMDNLLLLLLCFLVSSGEHVNSVPYDYSYTAECLPKPLPPQYGGGIVNNKYHDNTAHKFFLKKDKLYVLSVWLRVSDGNAHIAATFRTRNGTEPAGWVLAQKECWSMLKGGIVVKSSGPVELYFESDNPRIDIWADSVSLQPFTLQEWKSHQYKSVERRRKTHMAFQVVDHHRRPVRNAKVAIKQLKMDFPFGNAVSQHIIDNKAYQEWFISKFKYTVFENEMKWYATEKEPGQENYTLPDAMLKFAEDHNIAVRGHNVFWDDPTYTPSWVKILSPQKLSQATQSRMNSVMKRYSGKVIHWDINNENLHYNFYENKLGENASSVFFQRAHKLDGKAIPFMNDYNTLEHVKDSESTPTKYIQKIRLIKKQGYKGPIGIGLEGHFSEPNLPYVRASIDMLAALKLPIWITELDVSPRPKQAEYLEQLIRELHSHPAVEGIIMWGSWRPEGCWRMCLTDDKFKNLPTGDVVDKILNEWTHQGLVGKTNHHGFFKTSLFHGEYQVKITDPKGEKSFTFQKFTVSPKQDPKKLRFQI